MRKHHSSRKLVLSHSTLRALRAAELGAAAGGLDTILQCHQNTATHVPICQPSLPAFICPSYRCG